MEGGNKHLKISFLFCTTDYMVTEYIISADLVKDKPNENTPTVTKAYFLEKNIPWGDGEILAMKRDLSRLRLLEKGIATAICSPNLDAGYSKLFSFNPSDYAVRLPLYIRNINLQPVQGKAPEMTLAETSIINFEQSLLCEGGLEAFRKDTCPQTLFKCNKPEGLPS